VTVLEGVVHLRDLLQAFWAAVEKGCEAAKADYERVPDLATALTEYTSCYPGLAEKVKRDIPSVYLQVESASFR
jgi:hypothetical protein